MKSTLQKFEANSRFNDYIYALMEDFQLKMIKKVSLSSKSFLDFFVVNYNKIRPFSVPSTTLFLEIIIVHKANLYPVLDNDDML